MLTRQDTHLIQRSIWSSTKDHNTQVSNTVNTHSRYLTDDELHRYGFSFVAGMCINIQIATQRPASSHAIHIHAQNIYREEREYGAKSGEETKGKRSASHQDVMCIILHAFGVFLAFSRV